MQRALIVIVVLAVVAGGVLFATGAFDKPSEDGGTQGTKPTPDKPPPSNGDDGEGGELKGAGGVDKPIQPPAHKSLAGQASVLLVARLPDSWNTLLVNVFKKTANLEYRTWYTDGPQGEDTTGGRAGDGRGLSELKERPTAAWLKDNDVKALYVDRIDPALFPEDFWTTVADRVERGVMGLYFRPGYPTGAKGEVMTKHPVFDHEPLMALLPVAKADELKGTPTPGIFAKGVPFAPTAEGGSHPHHAHRGRRRQEPRDLGLPARRRARLPNDVLLPRHRARARREDVGRGRDRRHGHAARDRRLGQGVA